MAITPLNLSNSIPANPLLAEPMYLAGYIERMGTGTGDIIRLCDEAGLNEPEFIQDEDFKTVIWRTIKSTREASGEPTGEATMEVTGHATGQATGQAENVATLQANPSDNEAFNDEPTLQATLQADEETGEVSGEVSGEVKRVVLVISREMKRSEIQKILDLRSDDFFRVNYILPALESEFIEMTFPDSPNHPNQHYRLTAKGIALKKKLTKSKRKK